jgi:hypothetical protein
MPLITHYGSGITADTSRGPSQSLWGDCPVLEIMEGSRNGWGYHDDFDNLGTTPTITTTIAYGKYQAFGSSGATLTDGDEIGGTLVFTEATDNEGVIIADRQLPFQISTAHGDLWFEARVKFSTIADTTAGAFIGLIDSATISATVPIAAAGTLADENFVGWHRLEGDGDKMDFVYKADGVTQVTVEADAATLAADTYVKIGFRFNAKEGKLYHYVNGVPSQTTKTIPSAAGTDFPNDVRMGKICAMLLATGASFTMELDWWRCFQVGV